MRGVLKVGGCSRMGWRVTEWIDVLSAGAERAEMQRARLAV